MELFINIGGYRLNLAGLIAVAVLLLVFLFYGLVFNWVTDGSEVLAQKLMQ